MFSLGLILFLLELLPSPPLHVLHPSVGIPGASVPLASRTQYPGLCLVPRDLACLEQRAGAEFYNLSRNRVFLPKAAQKVRGKREKNKVKVT